MPRCAGQHSAPMQPRRTDLLQPVSLSRSQPGRTGLQQDQALSSDCNAPRQAGSELPRFRSIRVDRAMAAR